MSVELVRLVHHPWYEPGLAGVDLVVAETYVLLRRAAGCRAAISFLELVGASPRIKKLYSDPKLENEAERILRHYAGQGFSFVDAVSFAAMKRERIEEAFAFDRHFLSWAFAPCPFSLTKKQLKRSQTNPFQGFGGVSTGRKKRGEMKEPQPFQSLSGFVGLFTGPRWPGPASPGGFLTKRGPGDTPRLNRGNHES